MDINTHDRITRNGSDVSKISWTIERQLKSYSEYYDGTERYDVLWHAWKHNKIWLKELMSWVVTSFPSYSRHDESHMLSVLHNIEMLLGEKAIRQMSASDCFLILHVVYLHDIGMCVTHEDRELLMTNPHFLDFLQEIERNGESRMRKYAHLLLTYCGEKHQNKSDYDQLEKKLEIYYAIIYLVGEYTRKEHAQNAKTKLNGWIDEPRKLGIGFSTSGIPSRFYYTIGSCASVHTSYDFNDVLALPRMDSGYAHDYMHPRFAAVLLQLGDALDLDNDRFHPLVKEFMGELPRTSELHFEKHSAIRRLRISPEKITIEADCRSAQVLRMVNEECECIRDILKNATFHWSAICPEDMDAVLPNLEPVKLLLQGEAIQDNLVNVKFMIQQKMAFNLLQGSNIYRKDKFVFLREIFQNAVDASKLQYWKDWKGSRWYEKAKNWTIYEMGERLSPLSYPIEVEFHLARKERYGEDIILLDKLDKDKRIDNKNRYDYGVMVKVIDHGIGMTADDIKEIANVGTSYGMRKYEIEDMPSWLSPTAEFGIGLQSIFLVADSFTARTHPRTNENYEIRFEATGNRGKGYINVTPLKNGKELQLYGTVFEVFVKNNIRRRHEEDIRFWKGIDRFWPGYQENTPLRRSRELACQLAYYLESLVGERLFPIKVRLYNARVADEKEYEDMVIPQSMYTLDVENYCDGVRWLGDLKNTDKCFGSSEGSNTDNPLEKERKSVAWVYWTFSKSEKEYLCGKVSGDYHYCLNTNEMKLYLWNNKDNVFARFGADRIQKKRKMLKLYEKPEEGVYTRVFYKGIYTTELDFYNDVDLLEYIDIKGRLNREYLTINRSDFTEKGYEYIRNEIYPDVLNAAHMALDECAKRKDPELSQIICAALEEKITRLTSENEEDKKDAIQTTVLSAIGLSAFAQLPYSNENVILMQERKNLLKAWNDVLIDISQKVKSSQQKYSSQQIDDSWVDSTLFKITVFKKIDGGGITENDSSGMASWLTEKHDIAQILNSADRYAVVSRRKNMGNAWEEYLVWLNPDNSADHDDKESIESLVYSLQNCVERSGIIERLEEKGNSLKFFFEADRYDLADAGQSQWLSQTYILNWMLEKLPCVALFSNEDCTVRVNVLSLRYTKAMYQDHYIRLSVYQEMSEISKRYGIQRFYTIANAGYSQLAINNRPGSMYFLMRGKFSRLGQKYIIFPIKGELISRLLEDARDMDINKKGSQWYMIFNPILEIADHVAHRRKQWEMHEKKKSPHTEYSEEVKKILQELIEKWGLNTETEVIQHLVERVNSLIIDDSKIQVDTDDVNGKRKESDIPEMSAFNGNICDELLVYLYGDREQKPEIETWIRKNLVPRFSYIAQGKLKDYCEKKREILEWLLPACGMNKMDDNEEQFYACQNMVEYVMKHTKPQVDYVEYQRVYRQYIDEMVETVLQAYQKKSLKAIAKEVSLGSYNRFIS